MSSFKQKIPKALPAVDSKQTSTLQMKHTRKMNEFAKQATDVIPDLKADLAKIREQLLTLQGDARGKAILRGRAIKERLAAMRKEKSGYMLSNSRIVFDYYREKKDIETASVASRAASKSDAVAKMFGMAVSEPEATEASSSSEPNAKRIISQYLRNVDPLYLDMSWYTKDEVGVCKECQGGELVPVDDEGVAICKRCSVITSCIIDNEKPSYKEPPKEVCFYAYQKINHFKEIVAQFQGKQTTQIPPIVFERIQLQLKKERVNVHDLTYYNSKEILKNLGYPKMYEHIAYIKSRLGVAPPVFSVELEEVLFNLFVETQAPYARHCPDYRVNFLNYYYVLYKLCELVNEPSYLPLIPLLKDPEKLVNHDDIWKRMCAELDWKFSPTVVAY
jgi:hypothetical protein